MSSITLFYNIVKSVCCVVRSALLAHLMHSFPTLNRVNSTSRKEAAVWPVVHQQVNVINIE